MTYEFEGFRLDTERRLLFAAGSDTPLALPAKAIETLIHLVERHGELVEKSALIKAIWPRTVVEDNSVDRNIYLLRKVLGEEAGDNRFIVTAPGRGYRFVARLASGETRATPSRSRSPALPKLAATLAIAAMLVALLSWWAVRDKAGTPPQASIAILPFANLTGDPRLAFFGEGLAEELIYSLARTGLKVPARTSSFSYKGRPLDVRRIGHDLGVAYVLEGSLRLAADRIVVTAHLVESDSGYQVWSQPYERPFANVPDPQIFDLQQELAAAIVQVLRRGTQSGTPVVFAKPPTANPRAYRLLLEANAVQGVTAADFHKALALYDQALMLDPDFARALSARSVARHMAWRFGVLPPDALADAQRDAERAVELDPGFAGSHTALALVHAARGRWILAERGFRNALAIDGNDPATLVGHFPLLLAAGRWREAERVINRAHELAPLAFSTIIPRAGMNSLLGRHESAVREIQAALSMGADRNLGPAPAIYAAAAAHAGRTKEAAGYLAERLTPEARAKGGEAALILAYDAIRDQARRPAAAAALREAFHVERLESLDVRRGATIYVLFGMVGDFDSAYATIDTMIDQLRKSGTAAMDLWAGLWLPQMREFRRDPRFQSVVERLGLIEYWNASGPADACVLERGKLACN